MRSIDGHPLPIDELKGTKPIEAIDLSNKGLRVASGIIIAACIKENPVLKELKYATCPLPPRTCHCPVTFRTFSALGTVFEATVSAQKVERLLQRGSRETPA